MKGAEFVILNMKNQKLIMKTKPKEINILRVLTENKNRFVQPDKLVLDYNSTWQKKQILCKAGV